MRFSKTLLFLLPFITISTVNAETFTLSSQDISHGEFMGKQHEFNGFGCTGGDISPHLSWKDAPVGTKSFAITMYDPDAPTGSGWWHWQVVNIPAQIKELPTGAGSTKGRSLPKNSQQITNDYGAAGFGGACPPEGDGAHRYLFTVYALSVETLDIPADASGALAGYMINANTLESSTLQALYKRK